MATAQKRGFRFPWGGDAHRDEPPPDGSGAEGFEGADAALRPGPGGDDLGAGPFGLSGGATDDEAAGEAAEATTDAVESTAEALDLAHAAWPESDRRTVGPLAATGPGHPAPEPQASEPDASEPGAPVDATVAEVPVITSAPDVPVEPATPTPEPELPVAPPAPPVAGPVAATTPRRDNPLVAGLVRAMRDAARTARDETVAALHADATARTGAIRAQAALAVTELKKVAEADVASIKDWSRAELARVRAETETRIEARRTQLVADTEAAGEAAEDLLSRLHTTIEAFEAEMGHFFDVLLAEDDPARLAGLAERMPTAPDLEAFPASVAELDTVVTPVAPARPAVEASAAVVPEPTVGAEAEAETAGEAEPAADDAAVGVAEPATEPEPASAPEALEPEALAPEADDPRRGWLDHLDPDAAAAAEAEALAGLDRQTNVIVSGLSSVAGIAAFKGALVHLDGVSAVSVTAGANGDVLFTVTDDGQTDLHDAIRGLEAFETHVIADDGDTLSVAVREPAA